jgi:hypothetical protein
MTVELTLDEAIIALDAVMVFCKAVEAIPENDGTNLPEIEALQHKLERALNGTRNIHHQ